MTEIDWSRIHCGRITQKEIFDYIHDEGWQMMRLHMKNKNITFRYRMLDEWLKIHNNDRKSQVQVTNYINALSRGGMIKPEEYQRVPEEN